MKTLKIKLKYSYFTATLIGYRGSQRTTIAEVSGCWHSEDAAEAALLDTFEEAGERNGWLSDYERTATEFAVTPSIKNAPSGSLIHSLSVVLNKGEVPQWDCEPEETARLLMKNRKGPSTLTCEDGTEINADDLEGCSIEIEMKPEPETPLDPHEKMNNITEEILLAAAKFAVDNPEKYDQAWWCGTACCVLGHARALAGSDQPDQGPRPGELNLPLTQRGRMLERMLFWSHKSTALLMPHVREDGSILVPEGIPDIAAKAIIDAGAIIEARVIIGARANIGPRARIRTGVIIGVRAYIGADALIGPRAVIGAGVRIKAGANIVPLAEIEAGDHY